MFFTAVFCLGCKLTQSISMVAAEMASTDRLQQSSTALPVHISHCTVATGESVKYDVLSHVH